MLTTETNDSKNDARAAADLGFQGAAPSLQSHSPALKSKASVAIMVLAFCCVLWGWSFPTMQFASRAFDTHLIPGSAPSALQALGCRAMLNGIRFLLAGCIYGLLTAKAQHGFRRSEVVGGLVVGSLFGAGMLLQVLGLAWARPSVSGFLTSTTVIFAPIAQALLLRRKVGGAVWAAVALAMAGVTLLAWPNPSGGQGTLTTHPPLPLLGEILTLLAAIIFTAHILALDHYGQTADPRRLTTVMLFTSALLSLAVGPALVGQAAVDPQSLWPLATDRTVWWSLGSLILFSSVLAIPLMNAYQPRVAPATASVVYCSEPVFALLFSVMLGAEHLTPLTLTGGGAVLAAVLLVSTSKTSRES